MNDFTLKPDIEPRDPYQKALKDCMQAYDSIKKLDPIQFQRLKSELLNYAAFRTIVERFYSNGL